MHADLNEGGKQRLNMQYKSNYHSPGHGLHKNLPKSVAILRNIRKNCVRYFLFFYQIRALQKLWEMIFIPSKKFISFLRYLNFCISVLPSFSLCRPLLYEVINCLNKNSLTHFVSYLEKEKRYGIEILSRNILMEKSCRKYTPKASPWPLFSFG